MVQTFIDRNICLLELFLTSSFWLVIPLAAAPLLGFVVVPHLHGVVDGF